MSRSASRAEPTVALAAPFADVAYTLMERPTGAFDVALLLDLTPGAAPSLETLQAGAERAFSAYPKSRCRLEGARWVASSDAAPIRIERAIVQGEGGAVDEEIAHYLAQPMTIAAAPGIAERVFVSASGDREVLVFRMHHALGDLQSAVTWLEAQLTGRTRDAAIEVKQHPKAARKSPFAFDRPSEQLWRPAGARASGRRRFHTRALEPIRLSVGAHGFTWNDLLAAVALETFAKWNASHGAGEQVGCWIPVNVRTQRETGFGNGSSRIRVYRRNPWPEHFAEAAKRVREQVRWSKDHGEWHVPSWADRLMQLPAAISGAIVRAYARRPGVDWATGLFAHAERLGASSEDALPAFVERIGLVSHMHPEHPMTLSAVGHRGRTHLTFTWDEALFPPSESRAFLQLYESIRARAFAEVRGA